MTYGFYRGQRCMGRGYHWRQWYPCVVTNIGDGFVYTTEWCYTIDLEHDRHAHDGDYPITWLRPAVLKHSLTEREVTNG